MLVIVSADGVGLTPSTVDPTHAPTQARNRSTDVREIERRADWNRLETMRLVQSSDRNHAQRLTGCASSSNSCAASR